MTNLNIYSLLVASPWIILAAIGALILWARLLSKEMPTNNNPPFPEDPGEKPKPIQRCYIAGKIGDLPEAEYKHQFEQGKLEVEKWLGMEAVSPLDLSHAHGRSWVEYMREDLQAMISCTHLYALANWADSRGARIEVGLADDLGLEIIFQDPIKRHGTDMGVIPFVPA